MKNGWSTIPLNYNLTSSKIDKTCVTSVTNVLYCLYIHVLKEFLSDCVSFIEIIKLTLFIFKSGKIINYFFLT